MFHSIPHGTESILVVEDEELVASYAVRTLSRHGYKVVLARSGGEALEAVKAQSRFDLILTDVVMPGMNGKELVDQVRTMLPKAKVVFMSGYPEEVIGKHGILDSGIHFIDKPFTTQRLCEKVREVLDEPR